MGWGIVYPPYSVINMGAIQPPTPTTRWVYNFNGVDSYIDLNIPYSDGDVFTATYEASDNPSSILTIVDTIARSRVRIQNNELNVAGFTVKINGQSYSQGQALPTSGIVDIEFTATASDTITRLLAYSASVSSVFKGAFYNFKVNDGSVYNYPINDRTFGAGAVIKNTGTVFGGELVVNGGFDTDLSGWVVGSQWSWDSSGAARLTSDGSYNVLQQSGILQVGKTYLVEFDLLECDNLLTLVNSFDESKTIISTSTIGRHSAIFKPTQNGDGILFKRGSVNLTNALIDNVSVKEADGYATGINLLESGWTEINV